MTDPTRPNTIPWPPLILFAAVIICLLLTLWVPLPWATAPLSDILFAIGWLVIAAAIFIDVSAMRTLARHKTTIMPHRASDQLATDGPFALTRNPIYVGNVMLLVGIGLVGGAAWFLLAAPAAGFATRKLAIEREERFLDARFGRRYRDYVKRVRRWL